MKTYENAEFAAFEGAGGKGIVYAGVVKALEEANKLPLTNAKRQEFISTSQEVKLLKGVSGSSAGAITVFFIALGATSDEMSELTQVVGKGAQNVLLEEEITDNKGVKRYPGEIVSKADIPSSTFSRMEDPLIMNEGQTVFSLFYDAPTPGVIKAVGINDKGSDQSGFVKFKFTRVDSVNKKPLTNFARIAEFLINKFKIDKKLESSPLESVMNRGTRLIPSMSILDYDLYVQIKDVEFTRSSALQAGREISSKQYQTLFSGLPDVALSVLNLRTLPKKKVKNSEELKPSEVFGAILESPEKTVEYTKSFMFDHGLFTGINVNRVLAAKMSWFLRKNFDVIKSPQDCANMNYFDFVNITGNDLRIGVTNISQKSSRLCSCFLTPDFPVVSSVSASMSIPLAFKPTFYNGVPRKNKIRSSVDEITRKVTLTRTTPEPIDSSHNSSYQGFLVDGGVLMNLPIHAFDFYENEDKYLSEVVEMNEKVIGVRCEGGYPVVQTEDPAYSEDLLYKAYQKRLEEIKKEKGIKDDEQDAPNSIQYNFSNGEMSLTYIYSSGLSSLQIAISSVLGTLLSPAEKGQFRSENEVSSSTIFYAYDIETLDFAVLPPLAAFVQVRSYLKMALKLQPEIDKDKISEIVEKAFENYYSKNIDTNKVKKEVVIDSLLIHTNNLYRSLVDRSPNLNSTDKQ